VTPRLHPFAFVDNHFSNSVPNHTVTVEAEPYELDSDEEDHAVSPTTLRKRRHTTTTSILLGNPLVPLSVKIPSYSSCTVNEKKAFAVCLLVQY
jgi:hypothetical protein